MRLRMNGLRRFMRGEEAAVLVEYALLGLFILAVCVVVVTLLGPKIKVLYDPLIAAL